MIKYVLGAINHVSEASNNTQEIITIYISLLILVVAHLH
jgi:hypothetical protein